MKAPKGEVTASPLNLPRIEGRGLRRTPGAFQGEPQHIGLGVGIVGVAVASGKGSDADEQLADIIDAGDSCPAAAGCADVKAALADQSTFQDLGTVGFIGMGVGLATLTVGLIVLATQDDAPTSARETSRPTVQAAAAPTGSDLGGSLRVTF